jgi:hypothetical protein
LGNIPSVWETRRAELIPAKAVVSAEAVNFMVGDLLGNEPLVLTLMCGVMGSSQKSEN